MKLLTIFFLFSFTSPIFGQATTSFSNLSFDKVMMYDFKGGKGLDLYIVDSNGKLARSISNSIELSGQEIKKFNARLESKKSYGGSTAACFDPHLGLVYYLHDTIVAHITICLDCNRLHPSIEIPAQQQGKVSVGTDTYYTGTGLSESFRYFINSLLIKYHFSQQLVKTK